jgi:hypothetical protein
MRSRLNSAAIISAAFLLVSLLSGNWTDFSHAQNNPGIGIALHYGEPRQLSIVKDERINESSGIAASIRYRGAFWTHNDSGDSARIFLINKSGETMAVVNLKDVSAYDWEDIASFKVGKEGYILIADTGDNARRRENCVLYIIREPEIKVNPENKEAPSVDVEPLQAVRFNYEDGPHDCESVAVDPSGTTVYFVSKAREGGKVYSMPIPSKDSKEANIAKAIADIKLPYVTAMDISSDSRRAVILTYGDAYEFDRLVDGSWAEAFSSEPSRIKTPTRKQGESICYGSDGKTLFLTSENAFQPIWEIPVVDESGK